MGCSTCGQAKASITPGATAKNPIYLGEPDGRKPQPATFLVEHPQTPAWEYRFVAGDGVEQAVEDGVIALGYVPRGGAATSVAAPEPESPPQWYVRIGKNRWLGFKSKGSADRYASARGGTVLSYDQVLAGEGD